MEKENDFISEDNEITELDDAILSDVVGGKTLIPLGTASGDIISSVRVACQISDLTSLNSSCIQ